MVSSLNKLLEQNKVFLSTVFFFFNFCDVAQVGMPPHLGIKVISKVRRLGGGRERPVLVLIGHQMCTWE